jgi:ribosomal protein S17
MDQRGFIHGYRIVIVACDRCYEHSIDEDYIKKTKDIAAHSLEELATNAMAQRRP